MALPKPQKDWSIKRMSLKSVALLSVLVAFVGLYMSRQEPGQIRSAAAAMEEKIPAALSLSMEKCRPLFRTDNQGGVGEFNRDDVKRQCSSPNILGACEDLQAFTGLNDDEFYTRMERRGRFHFEGEHNFWNPQSSRELAWFYSHSVDYLFANAIHSYTPLSWLNASHVPILEYSGGVGNNVLYLTEKLGLPCQYFGIGLLEYGFAEFRVQKHGVRDKVTFVRPYSAASDWKFDPINGPLPRDESLGAILAMDVLEHIPQYHKVVEAMVQSLKVGGVIVENTPFGSHQGKQPDGEEDLRVHVSDGGISMAQAMGPHMKPSDPARVPHVWTKIASTANTADSAARM